MKPNIPTKKQITYLNVLTGLAIWTKRSTWFPQISQLDSSTSSSGSALCARISFHRVFEINNMKSQEENQPETGRRALLLREQRDPTHLRHHGLLVPGNHHYSSFTTGFPRVGVFIKIVLQDVNMSRFFGTNCTSLKYFWTLVWHFQSISQSFLTTPSVRAKIFGWSNPLFFQEHHEEDFFLYIAYSDESVYGEE